MTRLLQLGFLLGLAATIAAGYFLPWIGYERYPSVTSAVINGGRGETFLIRLPNDRIEALANTPETVAGEPQGTPVRAAYPAEAGLDGTAPSAVEHYKLRDVDGNVVGVAARHATVGTARTSTGWLLTLPSRGAVAFGGDEDAIDRIESALRGAGWTPGAPLESELAVERLGGLRSVVGTGEFADIDFALDETWTITGIGGDGALHGTIELATVGRKPQ